MTYAMQPCSIPNPDPAELAAAEAAARREARERIVAAVRARAAEEARVAEALVAEADAASDPGEALSDGAPQGEARGGFGRGWISAERDIGVPGEGGDESPLLFRGGGAEASAAAFAPGFHHPPAPSPEVEGEKKRIWRSIDFSPPRRALFLHYLAEEGNVRAACSRVQISAQSVYLARRRDPIFRAGWDAALVHSREHALQVLANQALEGVREEVWHRGELVGHRVRHDARLLLAHLGRLDARCKDARAAARAERFDELLALVAGEDYAWALRDPAADEIGESDPILPVTRERHSDRAAAVALGADDEPEPLDHDEIVARDLAEAEWDDWGTRVDAVGDALAAGEEPVVAPLPGAACADEDEDGDGAGMPPYEVKSRGGVPPRPRRSLGRRRTGGAAGLGMGLGLGIGGAHGNGAEFFARTPFGSSTCPIAAGAGTRC